MRSWGISSGSPTDSASPPGSRQSELKSPAVQRDSGAFLTEFEQFQTYCDTPGIDIERDKSGFSLSHVYLTDEELENTVAAISKILAPLQSSRPAPDRKLRTIGVIVSPEQRDTK